MAFASCLLGQPACSSEHFVDLTRQELPDGGAPSDAGAPPPARRVVSIAAGNNASCAVVDDGTAKCWGDPTTLNRGLDAMPWGIPAPVVVAHDIRQMSIGFEAVCALQGGRTVVCWGLGPVIRPAAEVPGLAGAAHVALGTEHACAILGDRRVFCWGDNFSAQLGTAGGGESVAAVEVPGIEDVIALDASSRINYAIRADGAVFFWGGSVPPALHPDPDDPRPGYPVTQIQRYPRALAVSCFGDESCVVLEDRTVMCTSLSRAVTGDDDEALFAVVPGIADVRSIDGSNWGYHVCAADARGDVFCWGQGLKVFFPDQEGRVEGVVRLDFGEPVAQIALGYEHACALTTSGSVICLGSNEVGQLGDADLSARRVVVDLGL